MQQATILPVNMDPQYTTESLARGMDFTPTLSQSNDTLTGQPTVTATCINGGDTGSPLALTLQNPSLSTNNMQVVVRISGGVSGAAYLIAFKCGTAQNNTVQQNGILYVV